MKELTAEETARLATAILEETKKIMSTNLLYDNPILTELAKEAAIKRVSDIYDGIVFEKSGIDLSNGQVVKLNRDKK